jgi:hypothetical protein
MLRSLFKSRTLFSSFKNNKFFSTSKEASDKGGFLAYVQEIFKSKTLEETKEKIQQEEQQETDYHELAKRVQDLSLKDPEIQKQLMEIHQSITKAQEESYKMKEIEYLLTTGKLKRA